MPRTDGYAPLRDYAAIGDGRAVALVATDGAIDWLCLPRADAPSVHAAILDPVKGGSTVLAPEDPARVERRYLPGTNVLETTFHTEGGAVARLTDAVTLAGGAPLPWHEIVRRVEVVSGTVRVRWRWEPRPDYGRAQPAFERRDGGVLAHGGGLIMAAVPHGLGEPRLEHDAASGDRELHEGESAALVLTATDGRPLSLPDRAAAERRLEETAGAWRRWLAPMVYDGPHREAVERSVLALKLLTNPNGAIAAAATTSLPEVIGGERNFDYRFAWVRDLSFAVDAYLRLRMHEDADGALGWLLDAASSTHPRPVPMYHLGGRPVRGQEKLPLAGYRGSAPVHLGNNASSQLQLGGWGDLIEPCWLHAREGNALGPDNVARLADTVRLLERIWRNADAGLWELSPPEQYASSKLGCWVAFDRAVKLAERGVLPDDRLERWRACREEVRDYIESELWSDSHGSYLAHAGDEERLDAAWLLAARRGYADPSDPRMAATVERIRAELDAGGPLLYRLTRTKGEENAFLACSFWLAEALAYGGRAGEAGELLGELVGLANDVGLYSEEIEPESRALVGNIPQALTHLSLIHAAVTLAERQDG